MESHWINEQENSFAWQANPSASEQENVLDWLKSIGTGAAQGATTGMAAGPWGALVGGLIGGGLGALQQATQQASPQRPVPPPAAPMPAPQAASPTPPPVMTSPPSQPVTPAPPPAAGKSSGGAVQQFAQLLPQLVQLIQSIQPIVASAQQAKGRTGESADGESDFESLAGDVVPDRDFIEEQEMEPFYGEEQVHEDIEPSEPLEPATPHTIGVQLDTSSAPSAVQTQLSEASTMTFPSEWITEAESLAGGGVGFQWIG